MPTGEALALLGDFGEDRVAAPVPVPPTHSCGNKDQISSPQAPPAIRGAIFAAFWPITGFHRLQGPRVNFWPPTAPASGNAGLQQA